MFGLLWILFLIKEKLDIFLRLKKLLHLIARLAVVRVACFLFCQQFGIFRIQLLNLGERFQIGFIKRRFRRLVQRDFCAVLFQKLFAVPSFTVGIIHRSSLGIVDDVCFQHCDF